MSTDNYKIYLKQISRYPLMTDVESAAIAGEMQAKRESIITGNLRLVAKIAIEMASAWPNVDVMDLIQEGNMALMRSIDFFDPAKGKFTTLVGFTVRTAIMTYIKDTTGAVRLYKTKAQRQIFNNLVAIKDQFQNEGVSIQELADKYKTDSFVLEQILGSFTPVDIGTIMDESPEDRYIQKESQQELLDKIARFRKTLSTRERLIFDETMYEGQKSLTDVGTSLGVTRSAIWNTKARILTKAAKFFSPDDQKLITVGDTGGTLSNH